MKIVIIIKLCKGGCKEMKNIVSEVYRKKTLICFKSVTGILKKLIIIRLSLPRYLREIGRCIN